MEVTVKMMVFIEKVDHRWFYRKGGSQMVFIEKVDHRWFYREGHRLRGKKLQVGRAWSEQSLVMHISQIINIYQHQYV